MDKKSIIKSLGGPSAVARLLGVHRTRVHSWLKSKRIPIQHHRALLAEAERCDLEIEPDDLLPPAEQGEAA